MRVVEPDQPGAVRRMQCERVRQAVWPLLGCLDALDLELEPVALFEMMDAPIEREQELQPVFGFEFISSHDTASDKRVQGKNVPRSV
jgi:hypothetical protein